MADHLEVETKYEVDADFQLPELARLAPGGVAARHHHLVATYFDTTDLRLAARGATLRRRSGGEDSGWHLKLPWGPGAKREFHEPLTGETRHPPKRLAELALAATRGAALRPVARITTDRTEYTLSSAADLDPYALLADDEVAGVVLPDARDGAGEARRWRELEVESAEASGQHAERIAELGARLDTAGAVPAKASAKLLGLLGDRVPAAPPRPTGGSASDIVLGYLWDRIERLLAYDPRMRLLEEDAVHQMRVSTRQIRTVLQAFPSVVDQLATRPVAEELRWLAQRLSTARDLEVLHARFTARLAAAPASAAGLRLTGRWLSVLDDQRRAAETGILGTLRGRRYLSLLADLDALRRDPPLAGKAQGRHAERQARAVLGADLARAWRRMERAHDRAHTAADEESRRIAWHDVRKAAKRVRYAAMVTEPALGKPARRLRRAARDLQEVLGDHQDGVTALAYLNRHGRRLAAAVPPSRRDAALVTLGVLAAAEQANVSTLLDRAAEIWHSGPTAKQVAALPRTG